MRRPTPSSPKLTNLLSVACPRSRCVSTVSAEGHFGVAAQWSLGALGRRIRGCELVVRLPVPMAASCRYGCRPPLEGASRMLSGPGVMDPNSSWQPISGSCCYRYEPL